MVGTRVQIKCTSSYSRMGIIAPQPGIMQLPPCNHPPSSLLPQTQNSIIGICNAKGKNKKSIKRNLKLNYLVKKSGGLFISSHDDAFINTYNHIRFPVSIFCKLCCIILILMHSSKKRTIFTTIIF